MCLNGVNSVWFVCFFKIPLMVLIVFGLLLLVDVMFDLMSKVF